MGFCLVDVVFCCVVIFFAVLFCFVLLFDWFFFCESFRFWSRRCLVRCNRRNFVLFYFLFEDFVILFGIFLLVLLCIKFLI